MILPSCKSTWNVSLPLCPEESLLLIPPLPLDSPVALSQSAPEICLWLGKGGEGDGRCLVVSAFHLPSLNLSCLLQVSEKRCKQRYHSGASEMLFSRYFSLHFWVSSWNFFFISLESFFLLDVWVGLRQRAGRTKPD